MSNHNRVFENLYRKKVSERTPPKFKIGDQVRIILKKKIFDKGYTSNWSNKIYTVAEIFKTIPTTYKLEDNGRPLAKKYYEPELQKREQIMFHIEKILGPNSKFIDGKIVHLTTPIFAAYWLHAHMIKSYLWEFYWVLGD